MRAGGSRENGWEYRGSSIKLLIRIGDVLASIPKDSDRIFTKEELKRYDGSNSGDPIYLAVLGQVFDVTKGKAYQSGGSYHFFTGKDGSKAFTTGQFTKEGLIDDLSGMLPSEISSIYYWRDFYAKHKDYFYVGKLEGTFYDSKGNPTEALHDTEKLYEQSQIQKEEEQAQNKKFPGCNSSSSSSDPQIRLWCTDESGGIKRDWVGVPRKFYKTPDSNWKCVCVNPKGPLIVDERLQNFVNVDPNSSDIKYTP